MYVESGIKHHEPNLLLSMYIVLSL